MENVNANAAPAPQAVTAKQPLWMSCATLDDLNAYIKRAKISTAKADDIRAKWGALPREDAPVAVEVVTEGPVLPMSEHFDAEEQKALDAIKAPAVDHSASNKRIAAFVANGNNAQNAVDEIIAKAKGTKRTKIDPDTVAVIADRAAKSLAPAKGLVTRYIDPTLIDVKEGWNARIDFGDLEELGRQIKAQKDVDGHGLLNDIRVQEKGDGSGRYWLVDGERRYQAVCGLIDQGEFFEFGIPAKIEPADAKADDLIIKMFLANEGKHLLPYEEGVYFKRLQTEFGMTIKQIEQQTGRSDSTIWYGLALVEADEDLVDAIRKGAIGTTIAKTIAVNARGDKAKQKELTAKAKAAKGDNKKTAALKKEIDDARREKAKKERPGLALKARKADEAEISALGATVGARLKEVMEKMGMDLDTDLTKWVSDDRELQIAANFGALQALKAIMGVKVKVEF